MPGGERLRSEGRAAGDARNATSRDGGIAAQRGGSVPFWGMASIGLELVVFIAPPLLVAVTIIVTFFL
jgi:hypothetical protein